MNRRLIFAGLALAGVTAAFWWLARPAPSAEPLPPVAAAPLAPDAAVVIAVPPPSNPGAPPLPTDIAVVEPVMPDAGEAIEVTLEVFDEQGHVAGGTVVLKNPPCGAAGERPGGVEVEARTNVMGFARIALVPGRWEVENFRSTPPRIEVGVGQTAFVLRKSPFVPQVIEGLVIDDQSLPVAAARVGTPPSGPHTELGCCDFGRAGPHDPPVGDTAATTDGDGRFSLRTYAPSLALMARKDVRVAGPVAATAGTNTTRLRLFTPAVVRFTSPCPALFVQYEYGGETLEVATTDGAEVVVASGDRRFRGRCLKRGTLMGTFAEAQLPPGAHQSVAMDAQRLPGLEVQLVTASGMPVPGVTVLVRDPKVVQRAGGRDGGEVVSPTAIAISNPQGKLTLVPDTLSSFEPLYRLEVLGAWRPERETIARLGDQPVKLVIVPR